MWDELFFAPEAQGAGSDISLAGTPPPPPDEERDEEGRANNPSVAHRRNLHMCIHTGVMNWGTVSFQRLMLDVLALYRVLALYLLRSHQDVGLLKACTGFSRAQSRPTWLASTLKHPTFWFPAIPLDLEVGWQQWIPLVHFAILVCGWLLEALVLMIPWD